MAGGGSGGDGLHAGRGGVGGRGRRPYRAIVEGGGIDEGYEGRGRPKQDKRRAK